MVLSPLVRSTALLTDYHLNSYVKVLWIQQLSRMLASSSGWRLFHSGRLAPRAMCQATYNGPSRSRTSRSVIWRVFLAHAHAVVGRSGTRPSRWNPRILKQILTILWRCSTCEQFPNLYFSSLDRHFHLLQRHFWNLWSLPRREPWVLSTITQNPDHPFRSNGFFLLSIAAALLTPVSIVMFSLFHWRLMRVLF